MIQEYITWTSKGVSIELSQHVDIQNADILAQL